MPYVMSIQSKTLTHCIILEKVTLLAEVARQHREAKICHPLLRLNLLNVKYFFQDIALFQRPRTNHYLHTVR